ncbi:glucuronate isomerase [Lewinella marina]|uniref:Uronate isomerase n=1 Tax=Neolewinella marina TaxID=438751 RepID=A0A2G0CIX2_9BACT|nr:glucuronate isomerase [Neolewinella marina]NJB84922.1 glucuronate isomerase [Neolewinella marina]PHK99925.1 glucuronate isomerase [Neolewinella marina]
MQNPIVAENFLLESDAAQELYHGYAAGAPIIDYHCHLPPEQLASDHRFANLTDIWLRGDHYKWRAMRANGISEDGITGSASDREKHRNWAATLPYTMRNPLYHWSLMELDRYFGVDSILGPDNADAIYDRCSEMLQGPDFSVRSLVDKMNVKVICTTDDPTDRLEHHQRIKADPFSCQVLPGFRPDKSILIAAEGYNEYMDQLARAADREIHSYDDLLEALHDRIAYFHDLGCRISDHGLNELYDVSYTDGEIRTTFASRRSGGAVSAEEARKFQTALLVELCREYHRRDWAQQFHLGALRNNNDRILRNLGADAGVDSIGDFSQARGLARLLNTLDNSDQLARTIVYNLNPADNEVMATMVGNFNDGSVAGKMQFGSAWWFLDQLDGMEKQMNVLSNMGLLSRFVGMLTDSRSFLSFPRHEYFRRLLCNMFGQDIERGLLPDDRKFIGQLIENICYHNAKNYFNFPA